MIVANIPSANYSLEEKVVGTWIDGKPLYQIVVTKTILDGAIDLLNEVDTLVASSVVLIDNTNNRQYTLYDYLPNVTSNVTKLGLFRENGKVSFECNGVYGEANANLISGGWSVRTAIQYTKTTD